MKFTHVVTSLLVTTAFLSHVAHASTPSQAVAQSCIDLYLAKGNRINNTTNIVGGATLAVGGFFTYGILTWVGSGMLAGSGTRALVNKYDAHDIFGIDLAQKRPRLIYPTARNPFQIADVLSLASANKDKSLGGETLNAINLAIKFGMTEKGYDQCRKEAKSHGLKRNMLNMIEDKIDKVSLDDLTPLESSYTDCLASIKTAAGKDEKHALKYFTSGAHAKLKVSKVVSSGTSVLFDIIKKYNKENGIIIDPKVALVSIQKLNEQGVFCSSDMLSKKEFIKETLNTIDPNEAVVEAVKTEVVNKDGKKEADVCEDDKNDY